jgi:excinuclease ABC subunit A
MAEQHLLIKGAREHNLKNIDVQLPKNSIIVITGISGSGKSSLAFDTIYAEGKRRYVESLSAYARQFLEQLQKPHIEYIEGLSPTVAIEQRKTHANPRSTVGTTTEIYDYLRLLFSKVGKPHCYKCGRPLKSQPISSIIDNILSLPDNTKVMILAPVVRSRKGHYKKLFKNLQKAGYVRVRVNGKMHSLDDNIELNKNKKHDIEVIIDRLKIHKKIKRRLTDSVETALNVGSGIVVVNKIDTNKDIYYNQQAACIYCGISYGEFAPRSFSFNSPYGACPACNGLGTKMEIDPDLVVPDDSRSLNEGALEPWRRGGRGYILHYRRLLKDVADYYDISMDVPFRNIPKKKKNILFYGAEESIWGKPHKGPEVLRDKPYEGIIPHMMRLFQTTDSDYLKQHINKYMSSHPCPECHGARLRKEALAVTINDTNIYQITQFSVKKALIFFNKLNLDKKDKKIAQQILKEITARLEFLINVGLDYLTLDRRTETLSGGEAQRIRLTTQIGSGLTGVIYVLDEPSIGLHFRDNKKLLDTLSSLRDLGNTLIVVEHDEATIRNSDHILDLGPGAGKHGGEVIVNGNIDDVLKNKKSLTGKYLRGDLKIAIPEHRRCYKDKDYVVVKKAAEHNLKNIDVKIPLALFTCVTGVSGSGKSTLVDEILYRALARKLYNAHVSPGKHKAIEGAELIDKVIVIDQSPIGRTPRSNPATYTKAFDGIRKLFAKMPESKARGYKAGRFSFNVKGGRCENCKGDGIIKVEMHFLPDVYVPCEICNGARYNSSTLEIKYKGYSISDILNMKVEQALQLFKNIPKIKKKLKTLSDVGLGYIELGQPAPTLSGGEAQRVKLSSELGKRSTGKTFYILDEPTTGLHFADIDKLLNILHRLTSSGNTVVVIEHNLDVIKTCDYIIDLGPEGGEKGGYIVAKGNPEEVAKSSNSYTGKYLKKYLNM